MTSKIALFIDAENISYSTLPRILQEVPRHGELILRAAYGDWDNPTLQKWREVAEPHKFKFRHQPNPSKIKNSSDMKLIMDAMEVLFKLSSIDTFCLVSSDADFVPLCDKLRKSKKQVIGIGYQNAAEALIRACDKFIFIRQPEGHTEPLLPLPVEIPVSDSKAQLPPKSLVPVILWELLLSAFAKAPQDANRWVTLTALSFALRQIKSGFQESNYGFTSLAQLLQSMPDLIEIRANPDGNGRSARLKSAPDPKQNGEVKSVPIRTAPAPEVKSVSAKPGPKQAQLVTLKKLLIQAFANASENDNGWVTLTGIGQELSKIQKGFKTNTYGHSNLTKLLQTMPDFVELKGSAANKSARLKK